MIHRLSEVCINQVYVLTRVPTKQVVLYFCTRSTGNGTGSTNANQGTQPPH